MENLAWQHFCLFSRMRSTDLYLLGVKSATSHCRLHKHFNSVGDIQTSVEYVRFLSLIKWDSFYCFSLTGYFLYCETMEQKQWRLSYVSPLASSIMYIMSKSKNWVRMTRLFALCRSTLSYAILTASLPAVAKVSYEAFCINFAFTLYDPQICL